MEGKVRKRKLSQIIGRERRDLRGDEGEPIVSIPPVLGIVPVRVEPVAVTIAIDVEEVRIAVGIVWRAVYATTR